MLQLVRIGPTVFHGLVSSKPVRGLGLGAYGSKAYVKGEHNLVLLVHGMGVPINEDQLDFD